MRSVCPSSYGHTWWSRWCIMNEIEGVDLSLFFSNVFN